MDRTSHLPPFKGYYSRCPCVPSHFLEPLSFCGPTDTETLSFREVFPRQEIKKNDHSDYVPHKTSSIKVGTRVSTSGTPQTNKHERGQVIYPWNNSRTVCMVVVLFELGNDKPFERGCSTLHPARTGEYRITKGPRKAVVEARNVSDRRCDC